MAQYRVETGTLDPKISSHYEVVMLANNANGDIISRSNPLPVSIGSDTINIIGNIAVPTTVNVASSPENPVHTHITEVGTSGNLSISYLPIGGNVNVTNLVTITGNVTANGTINVGNTVQVNVTNFPVTQNVTIMKNGLAVSDTVGLPTRVINDEALISYARGKPITEADVLNAYLIDKSGATETLGVSANTMSTVWGGTGLYPWTTFTGTGDKIYIKSVTNDPKVQGKSVTIEGLDSNYDILIETVTLHASNTMIAVSTVNNFYRTNKMYLTGNNTNELPHDYNKIGRAHV